MTTPLSPDDHDSPLADAERQRLVAYLDGELSADDCRDVESELAGNEVVRSELQRLDRVWNALDALPRATVDDKFTRSTVEMVAADAKQHVEQLTAALPVQRRRRSYKAVLSCVAAVVIGLVVTRGLATRNDRQVLMSLPVVYQVDALGQFEDPDFLRQLRQRAPTLVAEFEQADYQGVAVAERAAAWQELVGASLPERAAWVSAQPDPEKLRLQRAWRRYRDASPAARESAGLVLATLNEQDDSEQLFTAAVAYQSWLATLTPKVQSRLRQIDDPNKRLAEIAKLHKADRFRAERTLLPEDAVALREAIVDLASDSRLESLREAIANRLRRGAAGTGGERSEGVSGRRFAPELRVFEQRFKTFPVGPIVVLADLAGGQSDRSTQFLRFVFRDNFDRIVEIAEAAWPQIEARLMRDLSPAAKGTLADLSPTARANRLRAWVREAATAKPDAEAIEAYFASDSLTDAERHELLALPTEEMKRRLARRYAEEQFSAILPEPRSGGPGPTRGDRRFRDGGGQPGETRGRGPGPKRRPGVGRPAGQRPGFE
ncbi:MAG: hypothetical protein AAGG46_00370 [Planctomycetota bacterium]